MATYILLSSLTAQGVQTLKSNPDRLREVNSDIQELGAQVVHQWATLGEYDFVNVVEAPDSATIARVSVALGARGSTKIRTLTALTIDEFLAAGVGIGPVLRSDPRTCRPWTCPRDCPGTWLQVLGPTAGACALQILARAFPA